MSNKIGVSEVQPESLQVSKMETFALIANGWKQLTIFVNLFILVVCVNTGFVSAYSSRDHCVKKCPYSEFFWSAFSFIGTEYGEIRSISSYMRSETNIVLRILWSALRSALPNAVRNLCKCFNFPLSSSYIFIYLFNTLFTVE